MKHPPLGSAELLRASGDLGVPLTAEQASQVLSYEDLLRDRAIPLGLIAGSDAPRLRERHILDCLRAVPVAEGASTALDLGSGSGLPGIVVAIALPGLRVGLVEGRRVRASFLELAVESIGLANARVIGQRLEKLDEQVDVCFARALAPLDEAWERASRLLAPAGRLVYFEGRSESAVIPPNARVLERRETPVLESAGALVIMGRQ